MKEVLTGVLVLFALLALMGCESDAKSIREANERSATMTPETQVTATYSPPSPTPVMTPTLSMVSPTSPVPTPFVSTAPTQPVVAPTAAAGAEIESVEVITGDCIDSTLPEDISIETVKIVLCSGPWQYKVLDSLEVEDLTRYPGEAYFAQQALERCARRSSAYLFPTEDLWDSGNRAVTCLQVSFGLSVVDPAKLDSLVGINSLSSGECFNAATETDEKMVELVDCSGPWQYRALGTIEVEDLARYPGEAYFAQQALERCDRRYSNLLFPLVDETWSQGDRRVICLQESFGLSVVDPEKLDRLVSVDTLNPGECINDAPETNWTMVELVDCSGPWQYRALGTIEVEDLARYPGEAYFAQQALERCDRRYSNLFSPLDETWSQGDRRVICLQESFGLSVVDPEKLDRLVSVDTLNPGECINDAPETDWTMVELVDCSGPWQYRALGTIEVEDLARYPGEAYFAQQALERCDRRYSYLLFPLDETWSLGDRRVTCLQESFGLSVVDPEKLDRLVGVSSLHSGDCFNNAPETNWVLIELASCSAGWEWKVTNVFDVPWDGEYPGSGYFDTQVGQNCGESDYSIEPSVTTWEWGDRRVVCMSPP